MKRIRTSGLLLTAALLFSCSPAGDAVEFKVMAWNIWHGGNEESLPSDGRPSVVNIIRDSGADVVLMIETYGSAPYIADSLGFEYHLLSDNLCIFSRYPIEETFRFEDAIAPFNFGGATILIADSEPVTFFDTWLHYLPDTRLVPLQAPHDSILAWENAGSRDDEIRAILSSITPHIEGSETIPIIMGGDFNSFSHLDWVASTKDTFNHGGRIVDWTISRAMTDRGFADTYRTINPDPLSDPGITWLSGHNQSGEFGYFRQDRIDYIYSIGSRLEIVDSRSYDVPPGDTLRFGQGSYMYPSDHGFVLSTFRIHDR
ncbi:endonuclease/exonuclease/phosphatase family protein [Gemmatimonadota bacterium]